MKTIEKKGLQCMAKEAGLDLYSLPYVDARPGRQEWLAAQPKHPPMVGALLRSSSSIATRRHWCNQRCSFSSR